MSIDVNELPKIPKGWEWVKLSEISVKITDVDHKMPKSRKEGIPFISAKDVTENGKIIFNDETKLISLEDYERLSKKIKPELDDIIYTRIGSIGRAAIITKEYPSKFQASYSCCYIRLNKKIAYNKFYAYLLTSSILLKQAKHGTRSIGVPDLGLREIRNFIVPLPPLNNQKQIALKIEKLMSQLDTGLASLQNTKLLLNQYYQAVLKAAMEGELTKEWREKHQHELEPAYILLERILQERRQKWEEEQLAKFLAKGKIPKDDNWKKKFDKLRIDDRNSEKENTNEWLFLRLKDISLRITDIDHIMPKSQPDGIPFISAKDVTDDGKIIFNNNTKMISDFDYNKLSRKIKPEKGDIIYTRIGSIGRVATVNNKHPKKFQVSYSCCFIRLPKHLVSTEFYSHLLRSESLIKQAKKGVRSIGVPDLGLEDIRNFTVPLPSLQEQNEIVERLEYLMSFYWRTKNDLEVLTKKQAIMRQCILKSAFEGNLIQDNSLTDIKQTNLEEGKTKIINSTQTTLNGWKKNE